MKRLTAAFAILLFISVGFSYAQLERILPSVKDDFSKDELDITAGKFTVDQKTGWVTATGNVRLKSGDQRMWADSARFNRQTGAVEADGNVIIKKGEFGTWSGPHIEFNHKTGEGLSGFSEIRSGVIRIQSESAQREENGKYNVNGMALTTCTNAPGHWHWCLRGNGEFRDNDYVKITHAVPYLFGVPFGWLPWAYRDLDRHYGLRILPGYTSKWGAYVKTAYVYELAHSKNGIYTLDGSTHVDWRSRRGTAFGQNLDWNLERFGTGTFESFYTHDLSPHSSRNIRNWISDYKDDRYRFRLFHKAEFTPRDQFVVRASYLSDSMVQSDFFEQEDRGESIPMNMISYEHRENEFSFGLAASGPLNDFYAGTSQLPEFWFDIQPRNLFWRLNYENQSRIGYMERDRAELEHADYEYRYYPGKFAEYGALRADTAHRFTLPFKIADALSVVPRAGYRGTYWSDGRVGDDIFRQSWDAGLQISMRGVGAWSDNRRHIIEPYLDYSYQPVEFSHGAENGQYYFDRFDRSLGWQDLFGTDGAWLPYEWHGIRPGVRNIWQTRNADGVIRTLLELDTYLGAQIDSNGPLEKNGVRLAGVKTRFTPAEKIEFRFRGEFDIEEESAAYVDFGAYWRISKNFRIGGGYIGRDHSVYDYGTSLVRQWNEYRENTAYIGFQHDICDALAWSPYLRYDARYNETDEVGCTFQYRLDCLIFQLRTSYISSFERIDGSERGDDFRVSFSVLLRAEKGSEEMESDWRTL